MFISRGSTRRRLTPGPTLSMKESTYRLPSRVWIPNGAGVRSTMGGTQITESDGNRWPPPKGEDPVVDHGSEFFTQKTEVVTSKFPYSVLFTHETGPASDPSRYYKFEGNWIANCFKVHDNVSYFGAPDEPLKYNFPPDLSSSRKALEVKGAMAVAACAPGNRLAQTASAIAEILRDMPHLPGVSLWENRLRAIGAIGAVGDEFLNVVFGIDPTINDVMSFLQGVDKVDKVVDQFIRDSGRNVRRQFVFPTEKSTTVDVLPHCYSPVGAVQFTGAAGYTNNWFAQITGRGRPIHETVRTRTTEREIWFSGAFTYHLPGGYDAHTKTGRRLLMAKLLGAQPDLNTLWQLAPWSWAVDWFLDAGTMVKNLQAKIDYGTVMRYGYVMEKTTTTDTFSAGAVSGQLDTTFGSDAKAPYPVVSPVTLRITTKKRIQANPFGFGLSWDGLSTVQQAIVAALGITRAVR